MTGTRSCHLSTAEDDLDIQLIHPSRKQQRSCFVASIYTGTEISEYGRRAPPYAERPVTVDLTRKRLAP